MSNDEIIMAGLTVKVLELENKLQAEYNLAALRNHLIEGLEKESADLRDQIVELRRERDMYRDWYYERLEKDRLDPARDGVEVKTDVGSEV